MTEAQVVEYRQGCGWDQIELLRSSRLAGIIGLCSVGARHRQRGLCGVAHVGLWELKIPPWSLFSSIVRGKKWVEF